LRGGAGFGFEFPTGLHYHSAVTVEQFKKEIAEAVRSYDRFVICIDKTPDQFETVVRSLMEKAIKAYESRPTGMRHGIALDRQVTIILSQGDTERPLCAIYFNLSSPYHKKQPATASAKPAA